MPSADTKAVGQLSAVFLIEDFLDVAVIGMKLAHSLWHACNHCYL